MACVRCLEVELVCVRYLKVELICVRCFGETRMVCSRLLKEAGLVCQSGCTGVSDVRWLWTGVSDVRWLDWCVRCKIVGLVCKMVTGV